MRFSSPAAGAARADPASSADGGADTGTAGHRRRRRERRLPWATLALTAVVGLLVAGLTLGATGRLSPGRPPPALDVALHRLWAPAAQRACLAAVSGEPTAVALAFDYARYDGQPALVIVVAVVPGVVEG